MVLSISRLFAALCLALLVLSVRPALAHEHNAQQEAAEQAEAANHANAEATEMTEHHHHGDEADEMMGHHHHDDMDEQRPTTFSGRLFAWLGNMHPFAVHFPIALIPASWLALLIARRRGHAVDVIRAVIMLAALSAIVAATLGWLTGGFALSDPDPIKTAHRWIGTTLAIVVGAIGIWAWRNTESVNSRMMVWTLGGTTALLLVQGWLGATLTHGINHMMF
jgi:uncharacterized membrane protein